MLQPYANWDFEVAKGIYLEINCEYFNPLSSSALI